MVIFRYLAKEIFLSFLSMMLLLLLIFMSNQLIGYLNRAANGAIPSIYILKLMLFELPTLLSLLLPLGFYIAVLLVLGRMYADAEMTVLHACGYGIWQLLGHVLVMALGLACFVLVMVLWLSPYIALDRAKILQNSGVDLLIKTVMPGHFRAVSDGEKVFYVESVHQKKQEAAHIFVASHMHKNGQNDWDILWAEKAYLGIDPLTHQKELVLEQGQKYQGVPGEANYQIASFRLLNLRLPPAEIQVKNDLRVLSTADLWPLNNKDLAKVAELQWRLSIPLMVICLAFVAVPLSRVKPRMGRYANLLPAIFIFIVYANFMFLGRDWVSAGKIPIGLGLWIFHVAMVLLALFLIWRAKVKP